MKRLKQTAAAVFGLAAFGLAGGAQAFEAGIFTVDETNLGLGNALSTSDGSGGFVAGTGNIFNADNISGPYNELLTIDTDGSFDATAWWRGTSFGLGLDTQNSSVTATGGVADQGYGLYVLFDASGSVGPGGFTAGTGNINIFLDPTRNTSFGFTGGDATDGVTTGNTGDDIFVGTSAFLRQGSGTFNPGLFDEGRFTLLFNEFSLSPQGSDYFVDPEPFFDALIVTGQFATSSGNLVAGTERTSFEITSSSADGQFGRVVPTPGALSLMGVGLLALGFRARRQGVIKG